MKKTKQNNEAVAPWEDQPEQPQQITAKEASAAAAIVPGNGAVATGSGKEGTAASGSGKDGAHGAGKDATATGSGKDGATSAGKASARNRWKPSLLGYNWVVRNIGFLLFLTALAVVYIYNGHYADKISRDINRTNKEVKELQYEYKTLKSEVMFRSKQSELARAVAPMGLKEPTRPPFVLIDSVQK